MILSRHLISKGVPATAHCALLFKVCVDRAVGQAVQTVAITAGSLGGIIVVVVGRRHGGVKIARGVELDGAVVVTLAAEDPVTDSATAVAVARAAHDVAEFDAARLAVPETNAEEEDGKGAERDGQGDGEGAALGHGRGLGGSAGGAHDSDGEGDGVCLVVEALGAAEEGDGEVGEFPLLVVVVGHLEWEEAP